ncbi:hypothetical protein F1C76_13240 [Geodermatophilaceae bacterium NBWT11]|nr:hypothetical protein F1C76_13240 [Geodermatophilaceae bacterium NBWT11]
MSAPDRLAARRAELAAKPAGTLTAMERGELRALSAPGVTAPVPAEERAAELLARTSLTPMERGQLRAAALALPAYERRQVEQYLNALAAPP